jgi:VTC domain
MSPSTETRENREFASELKFVITPALAEQIRDWVQPRLAPDPHASGRAGDSYPITSLYYDTEQFDVFHRRGSYGRSKLRIRRYGAGVVVFLERKLKTRGLLTKRRSIVRLSELGRLASAEPQRGWAGYWFQRRVRARSLAPVCRISYERTARVAMTHDGPIRLTLDTDVRAAPVSGLGFGDEAGRPILEERTILELKFLHSLPAVFKNLVEEFLLDPQPFSKYRQAAASLGLATSPADSDPARRISQYA